MHLSRLYHIRLSTIVELVQLFSICLTQLLCTVFLSKSSEFYIEARCGEGIVVDIIICLS